MKIELESKFDAGDRVRVVDGTGKIYVISDVYYVRYEGFRYSYEGGGEMYLTEHSIEPAPERRTLADLPPLTKLKLKGMITILTKIHLPSGYSNPKLFNPAFVLQPNGYSTFYNGNLSEGADFEVIED